MITLSPNFATTYRVFGDGVSTVFEVLVANLYAVSGSAGRPSPVKDVRASAYSGTGTVTTAVDPTGSVLTLTFSVAPPASIETVALEFGV